MQEAARAALAARVHRRAGPERRAWVRCVTERGDGERVSCRIAERRGRATRVVSIHRAVGPVRGAASPAGAAPPAVDASRPKCPVVGGKRTAPGPPRDRRRRAAPGPPRGGGRNAETGLRARTEGAERCARSPPRRCGRKRWASCRSRGGGCEAAVGSGRRPPAARKLRRGELPRRGSRAASCERRVAVGGPAPIRRWMKRGVGTAPARRGVSRGGGARACCAASLLEVEGGAVLLRLEPEEAAASMAMTARRWGPRRVTRRAERCAASHDRRRRRRTARPATCRNCTSQRHRPWEPRAEKGRCRTAAEIGSVRRCCQFPERLIQE
jgi:hypothetical protein